MLKICDREWKEFFLSEILNSKNSKAYHSENLEMKEHGVPYVTRTANSNGLFGLASNSVDYNTNPGNTISFGAETAEFFYQPHEYITGNKMYYLDSEEMTKYRGLFLVTELRKGIKGCFSYANGAIPDRVMRKKIMLPVKDDGSPDYDFMELFVSEREKKLAERYKDYLKKQLVTLGKQKKIEKLSEKKWKEFFVSEIFDTPKRGKRIISQNYVDGNTPVVSSAGGNNGVIAFAGNDEKVRFYQDCLSVANGGVSAGYAFYHPYKFIATDHVTHFKGTKLNKFHYLFLGTVIRNQMHEKYDFSREMTDPRLKREKLLLPVTNNGVPDFDYMEQYSKNIMINKYNLYLQYKSKQK